MPEFIPDHNRVGLGEFTEAYLAAAEWLLDEDIDREQVKGWSKEALDRAEKDCAAFQEKMRNQLELWSELGMDDGDAGHDFWLTRNRHGVGFWDRFTDEPGEKLGEELTECAHSFGEIDAYLGDDEYLYFM